jgi:hypothetical protein
MNERIDKLLVKAGAYFGGEGVDYSNFDPKKFAELIVRECAGIGDNYQEILGNEPECFNCRKVAYGIVDKIIQHFGVEE